MKNILITNISIKTNQILFSYEGDSKYAWFENTDKHLPDIIELKNNIEEKNFNLNLDNLQNIKSISTSEITYKLLFSDDYEQIIYDISNNIRETHCGKNILQILDNQIFLTIKDFSPILTEQNKILITNKAYTFEKKKNSIKPLNAIVFGTCFSRSIFKSDLYFNPNYKKFFNVKYTAFHNSIISVMSNKIDDNSYLSIKDMQGKDVLKYIELEFKKNMFEHINQIKPDFILIDNYIDAVRPVVQISENQFITYNKYFSESIYKRKFYKHKILYPGMAEHSNMYRFSVKKFVSCLRDENMSKKIILLGSRLSQFKNNPYTRQKDLWSDKLDWIIKSNNNWDTVDTIFLEELPEVNYIDMRNTEWTSDIHSPIKGGASPSHYQSEYYREILEKIKRIVFYGEHQNV